MSAPSHHDPWLGKALGDGRYRVEAVLGEGGMGAVYRARDEVSGATVAVKVLLPELAHEEAHLARFMREAKVAGLLAHPHLVSVVDTGREADGSPWLVMELVEGESLSAFMRARGAPLTPQDAAAIVRQAAAGISAAHGAGVVHRDLKPGNLMVVDVGGRLRVKVVDLGLARFIDTSTYTKLTMTGSVVGTPAYMAPEQAFGDTVDRRSDVFALGAVLHALLTGDPPFGRGPEVLPRLMMNERVRLTEGRRDLGPIVEIVERCLEPEPEDRYQSVEALGRALANFDTRPDTVAPWVPPKTMPSIVLAPDPVLDAPRPRRRPTVRGGERPPPATRAGSAEAAVVGRSPIAASPVAPQTDPPAPGARRRPVLILSALVITVAAVAAVVALVAGSRTPVTVAGPDAPSPPVPVDVVWGGTAGTGPGTESETGPESESETGTESESESETGTESGSGSGSESESESESETETESEAGSRSESESESGNGTGPHSLRIEVLESWSLSTAFLPGLRASAPSLASCLDADPNAPREFALTEERTDEDNANASHFNIPSSVTDCGYDFMQNLVHPPIPTRPGRLRLRVARTPVTDGEQPKFEVIDRTDWATRRRYPPRLRVTFTILEGQVSIDDIRGRVTSNRPRFASCLEAAGALLEAPPYRAQVEWTWAPSTRLARGHTMPRVVENCFFQAFGRTVGFPFTPSTNRMIEARVLFEAAEETSVVVVRPD